MNAKSVSVRVFAAALCLTLLFFVVSCGKTEVPEGLWSTATYQQDTTLGTGTKTANLTVKAGEKNVNFTIKTDKDNLGDALLELGLIEGDAGQYGLYVKKVNGILADYDTDKSYWTFNKNGTMAMTGVDGETIDETAKYELVYTK